MIWLKAAMIGGIVIASPWIFYQIWQFIAAGLYPHERKYVYIYLPFSLTLFFGGGAMAFFVVMALTVFVRKRADGVDHGVDFLIAVEEGAGQPHRRMVQSGPAQDAPSLEHLGVEVGSRQSRN